MNPCKDDDVIRKETTFIYDGDSYKFYLDDCTRRIRLFTYKIPYCCRC